MTPIEQIEKNGFTVLSGLFSEKDIDTALEKVLELEKTAPVIPDEYIPRLNKGAKNLYNLQAKDKFFIDLMLENKTLEQILMFFLNDPFYKQIPDYLPNYIMRSLGARSSTENNLPLHIDSFVPSLGSNVVSMQCILFLEDSTVGNGCTIAIPASHRLGLFADDTQRDLAIPIEAKKGDLYLQDSRLWHGALANTSDKSRWSLVMTATRWFIKQHFDCSTIPQSILELTTPKQRSILGFSSRPLLTELEGADIKRGYDLV